MLATLVCAALLAPPAFPPYVEKELYATNDLRGKQAPRLVVESWLHQADPNTRGKVLLIDFWATWCGPCRALIPELNEWQEKFKDDLVIIGLSDEPEATVRAFMEGTPMHYSVAIDTQRRMHTAVGVRGIPHVLVITKDRIVRWQGFPGAAEDKLTAEKLSQIIEANRALPN